MNKDLDTMTVAAWLADRPVGEWPNAVREVVGALMSQPPLNQAQWRPAQYAGALSNIVHEINSMALEKGVKDTPTQAVKNQVKLYLRDMLSMYGMESSGHIWDMLGTLNSAIRNERRRNRHRTEALCEVAEVLLAILEEENDESLR